MAFIDVAGMRDLVAGMDEAIDDLTSARQSLRSTLWRFELDTSRSFAVQPAVDWARAELPGLRRRLALAEALEGTRVEWPAGTVRVDESAISTMDPELATKAGQEAAAALRDSGGIPDEELLAQIEQLQHDPYFAAGFALELGPEELAAVVVELSHEYLPSAPADGVNAWYGRLLGGISTTLATATRGTGDLALPADYASRWVAAVTAEPPAEHNDYLGDGSIDHANALGLLLSQGVWGTEFLGTVAAGVYDYERAHGAEVAGPVWGPRSDDGSAGVGLYDAAGNLYHDPLAGIMSALGRNPVAAQRFFSEGGTTTLDVGGAPVEVGARLQYLVVERTWASDPSEGAALGSAIEAATTTVRDGSEAGRVSAEIAGQTFALIGSETHQHSGLPWGAGWQMWDGMRVHVSAMLGSYGADVFRVAGSGRGDDLSGGVAAAGSGVQFPDDMPYGVRLDLTHLERIVQTLGEDKDDLTPALTGLYQASNLAMATGMQQARADQTGDDAAAILLDNGRMDALSPALTSSATSVQWFLDAGFAGDKKDEELEKKKAELVAEALSVVSELPFVPEIEHEWVSWGLEQLKEHGGEAIKGTAPTDAASVYATHDEEARARLEMLTLNLLLQNGYLGEEAAAAALEDRGVVFQPPPPEALVLGPDGRPVAFATDSQAFHDWYLTSSVRSLLVESVVNTYASAWGSTS